MITVMLKTLPPPTDPRSASEAVTRENALLKQLELAVPAPCRALNQPELITLTNRTR